MNQECGLFYRMSNQIFHVIGHWVFIVVISDPTYMEIKKKYGKDIIQKGKAPLLSAIGLMSVTILDEKETTADPKELKELEYVYEEPPVLTKEQIKEM